MKISYNMSELIGAIIGDGNIYKNRYVEISGDSKLDMAYFKQNLLPIIENELSYVPSIRMGLFGVRLRINNKKFTIFLNNLGIRSGKGKAANITIPKTISKDWNLSKACIRGIIDTDGCLSFDKRKVYKEPYPRIILHVKSRRLVYQIRRLLSTNGYKPTISKQMTLHGEMHWVYLNGKEQVYKYIKEIGFSNNRHLFKAREIIMEYVAPVA